MNILFWKKQTSQTDWKKLIYSFLIILIGSTISSLFVKKSSWHLAIKSGITPPSYIFSIVWPILYAILIFVLYFTINPFRKKLFSFLCINLTANFIWTFLYFKLQMPLIAFIDLLVIWFTAILIINDSWRIDKRISYLMLPYFTWISFAGLINILALLKYCQLFCTFR